MKKKISVILCLMLSVILSGCVAGKDVKSTGRYIYYVNNDGNGLEKEEYVGNSDADASKKEENIEINENMEEIVEDILKQMKASPDDITLKSAIPKEVQVTEFHIKDQQIELHFNEEYLKMKKSTEVLCRAAIVQTLVQVDGIDYVAFYIGNEALRDRKGNLVGLMSGEDFVQNAGHSLNSYQTADLTLYFADQAGTGLVSEKISNIRYNSNMSIERLVVEQLMKGPSSKEAGPTIPKETKLLGVSVKDGVCYVNFDSSFLTGGYNLKPEVTIYSIVDSIIENGSVSMVQILIDGVSDAVYKGSVKLERPLEWSAELLEEQSKS